MSLVYKKLMGPILPVSWFAPPAPETLSKTPRGPALELEIVSHCWQYAHLLVYQISSLVNYPPRSLNLTYTLFYCEEDENTVRLVDYFSKVALKGLTWNWQPLAREQLFRRAIGRNRAALKTAADWVWFTDCDTIFHQNCLDSLATQVTGKDERMVFPAFERITPLLENTSDMLAALQGKSIVKDIDTSQFDHNVISKAKGAFQIVHGDVCRTLGYCNALPLFQTPTDRWRKTFEDPVFRKLIRSEGMPVEIQNLYRIRHIEKGRYAEGSTITDVRKNLRKAID